MNLVIIFTSPLPSIRSGLMKLAFNMITKITFNNSVRIEDLMRDRKWSCQIIHSYSWTRWELRMFMLKCLWVSHSKLWMWPEWSSSWRRLFMDFVKVHEHSGSILQKGSKPVDWNNPGLIHVSLYEPKWFVLSLWRWHHILEQGYNG